MKILVVKKSGVKKEYVSKIEKSINKMKWHYDIIDFSEIEDFYNIIHKKDFKNNYNILISFGGDGTILKSARIARKLNIPILGINVGTLGFLTSINGISNIDMYFECLSNKKYFYDNRYMIQTSVKRNNKKIFEAYAVNEATIATKNIRKIGKYDVYIGDNNELFNAYRADGLIVSTPTGSTAHSLSAGGPIVEPNVNCFILTAVCPHAFNERSIVISDDKKIIVNIMNEEQIVDIDGRIDCELKPNDKVIISKLKKPIKYITFKENFFINNIKNKIKNI